MNELLLSSWLDVTAGTVIGIQFQFTFPLEIKMPCGQVFTTNSLDTLKHDIPCPCGNPDHWIVKWGEA